MRDLDRERGRLEQQEKKVIADMKKTCQARANDAVKIMAKDLFWTRLGIEMTGQSGGHRARLLHYLDEASSLPAKSECQKAFGTGLPLPEAQWRRRLGAVAARGRWRRRSGSSAAVAVEPI
uniref:ACB domain-containing protein n=1 Tax=Macrostomum lignano TaxID=282301 RepID=A0A1I8FNZ0_9PLAT